VALGTEFLTFGSPHGRGPGLHAGILDKLAEQGWLGLVYPRLRGAGLGFVDLTC